MWSSDGESIFLNQNLRMIYIESLNNDDILSVILEIKREGAIKTKMRCLFKHH